jgi:hypothetical protein
MLGEEKLDCDHDVVDVAEAGCEVLLGVVQPAGPVDSDVGLRVQQIPGSRHGGSGVQRDVVPQTVEDWAVVGVAAEAIGDVLWVFRLGILRCDPG